MHVFLLQDAAPVLQDDGRSAMSQTATHGRNFTITGENCFQRSSELFNCPKTAGFPTQMCVEVQTKSSPMRMTCENVGQMLLRDFFDEVGALGRSSAS